MKTGTFIAASDAEGRVQIPKEVCERLDLTEGDKLEVLVKKIRSRRTELKISRNPLTKLLDLSESRSI